jgi:hypothetical protein
MADFCNHGEANSSIKVVPEGMDLVRVAIQSCAGCIRALRV